MTFIEHIFLILNQKTEYAILRNHEGLPDHCTSRDIDIIITRKDYNKIKKDLYGTGNSYGYKVLLIHESDRFDTIVWQKESRLIQFDFFFGTSAKGILLMDAKQSLKERKYNGKVYFLPEYMQFLDKFLFNRMVGKPFPDKYGKIRETVMEENVNQINEILRQIFGEKYFSVESVESTDIKELKRAARRKAVGRFGIKQLAQQWQFIHFTLNSLWKPRGLFLSFTGPDGVGKTTVLNLIGDTYKNVWSDTATEIHHFRPEVLPRIAALLHKAGAVKEVDENYAKPHRGNNRNMAGSLFRLFYYILDYQLGYLKKIYPRKFRRQATIYDRYYTDIIIDSQRSNIYLPYRLIYMLGKLVPQPNYSVLLMADEDRILQRKKELEPWEIRNIQNIMLWLKEKDARYLMIYNNGTAEDGALNIMNEIMDRQDKKYKKYFQRS